MSGVQLLVLVGFLLFGLVAAGCIIYYLPSWPSYIWGLLAILVMGLLGLWVGRWVDNSSR